MKILIVEDDDRRIRRFKRNLIGASVVVAKTSHMARYMLTEFRFDAVFLDYDLHLMDGSQIKDVGCGLDVAEFMTTRDCPPIRTVIIHSFNPEGAMAMHAVLTQAGILTTITARAWEEEEALGHLVRTGGWIGPVHKPERTATYGWEAEIP